MHIGTVAELGPSKPRSTWMMISWRSNLLQCQQQRLGKDLLRRVPATGMVLSTALPSEAAGLRVHRIEPRSIAAEADPKTTYRRQQEQEKRACDLGGRCSPIGRRLSRNDELCLDPHWHQSDCGSIGLCRRPTKNGRVKVALGLRQKQKSILIRSVQRGVT